MAGRLIQTKAWLLATLIFAGSLVLALVVPTASLWAISQLGRGRMESFYLGMLACPLSVVGWAAVLGRLNQAYREATGRRDDDLLAAALTVAVIAAIVFFVALLILGGGHDPTNAGPWPSGV